MGGLWRLLRGLSQGLGTQRNLVRRLASIAMVLLGVHAAAHTIDDVVFAFVDRVDLIVDQSVWGVLDWIANAGGLSKNAALDMAETFSGWVDLEQKEMLSHSLALLMELAIDLLLLDLAWGKRGSLHDDTHLGAVEELRQSTAALKASLWPLDLERLAAPLVLLFFTLAGAFSTGLAMEGALYELMNGVLPLWKWSINLSALAGLLFVALLIARFVPDLLFGGVLRAKERSEEAIEKRMRQDAARVDSDKKPYSKVRQFLRQYGRGWSIALVLLPLSVVGLLTQETFLHLVQRTGANL